MASDKTWGKCKHFFKDSKVDRWGDAKIIQDDHLLRLDDFRSWLGLPVFVTAGVKTTGHATGSFHYSKKTTRGKEIGHCATDIIIPDFNESPFDLVMAATRFGFTGIGYYPHWKWQGQAVGGLHVDSRPLRWDKDDTLNYNYSRWMGVMIGDRQTYIGLDFQNLLEHAVLKEEEIDLGLH